MPIDSRIIEKLQHKHQALEAAGELLSDQQIAGYLDLFRQRFGPDELAARDGKELLLYLHGRESQDCMAYWVEFKNDDEFPSPRFGSIAGGSALKFGIYQRSETGQWMTGAPSNQKVLTESEAASISEEQRDQFLAGVERLEAFASTPEEQRDYLTLQEQLLQVAPAVADSAWGHKYFSLLYPGLLDDYHATDHHRFHALRLLQAPPAAVGRYSCAGIYMALARQLGWHVNQLTTTLNARDGSPHGYWRVGTSFGDKKRSQWPALRDGRFVGIGWNRLGDLKDVSYDREGKEALRAHIADLYPDKSPQQVGRDLAQVFRFLHHVEPGDMVLAMDGGTVLGVARIKGDYSYTPGDSFAHRRSVDWLSGEEWKIPELEGVQTSLFELKKPVNLVEAERRALGGQYIPAPPPGPEIPGGDPPPALTGIPARIQAALERKGQVILNGPPGTGKTFWALRTARELMARTRFGKSLEQLSTAERDQLAVPLCTFHPAYGYEDFLEGYRPAAGPEGQLTFHLRDGFFKQACERARSSSEPVYLVIDEINRGDIPRIFGELLTVLELTKRGLPVELPLSGEPFSVPPNLYVIGTMNTADRSIALLDTALRRRFAFFELMPDARVLRDASAAGIPLGPWLEALNRRVRAQLGRDSRNLQIGHAYLMHGERPITSLGGLTAALRDDIVPLLREYCYEDFQALAGILGKELVDETNQEVREDLFRPKHRDRLVQALLAADPSIIASEQATAADARVQEEAQEEEGEAAPDEA